MPRTPPPSGWICTKFGLGCPPADVINFAEFCCSWVMGFDSVRGQNSPSPIPLTWPVAVNTVLALPRSLWYGVICMSWITQKHDLIGSIFKSRDIRLRSRPELASYQDQLRRVTTTLLYAPRWNWLHFIITWDKVRCLSIKAEDRMWLVAAAVKFKARKSRAVWVVGMGPLATYPFSIR